MKMPRTAVLFVPGDRPDFFPKAVLSKANTLIFDLEDAVAPAEKENSRFLVEQALKGQGFGGKELAVRINPLASPWGRDDLSMALRCPGIEAIVLPKAEPSKVKLAEQLLHNTERRIICLIETARGLQLVYETILASPRVEAVMLGAEDLAAEMNLRRTSGGEEISFARQALVLAAYAAGVQPIDTPYLQVRDLEGLRLDTVKAREAGFTAKTAISPRQVSVIREVFRPDPDEVKQAEKIVRAAEEAGRRGRAVVIVDGAMVDPPVIARARRVLELAGEEAGNGD